MLGSRAPSLFGRLTRAPAEMNEFPNFVVTEKIATRSLPRAALTN
jgi:hypothetical protein